MIKVRFTCHTCGLAKEIPVKARSSPNVDVAAWMETVKKAIADAHLYAKPNCRSDRVDLMIPMPQKDDGWIGQEESS